MRIFLTIVAIFAMQSVSFAMNDVCQKEFAPIIQSHAAVMQGASKLPKNKPKTYEQALANTNAHCSFLTKASGSFTRIQAWMKKNQDFCQVPDAELKVISTSIDTISKNRSDACGAVAKLKQQKTQAERQQALQQSRQNTDPFARSLGTPARANDPFNPQITRKPQLSIE